MRSGQSPPQQEIRTHLVTIDGRDYSFLFKGLAGSVVRHHFTRWSMTCWLKAKQEDQDHPRTATDTAIMGII